MSFTFYDLCVGHFPPQNDQINFVWRIYGVNSILNTHQATKKYYKGNTERENHLYFHVYYVIFNLNENFLMSQQIIILNDKMSPLVICTAILCALFSILKPVSHNASIVLHISLLLK